MSVEKYTIRKNISFTTIPNKVLQGLKNYEALGLYAYICSLPDGWVFYKKHLAEHAGIGRDRLNKNLKVLHAHNLIEYRQVRNQHGRFAQYDLHVKDGTSFEINELVKDAQPLTEKPLTDNRLPVNSSYKRNIDKRNNNTDEISKNLCASENNAQPLNENHSTGEIDFSEAFLLFWAIYPRKKDKARAWNIWKKKKYDQIATLICDDVENRKKNEHQWQDIQYIPHPTTYLRNALWTDEITPKTKAKGRPNNNFDEVMGNLDKSTGATYDESGNRIYANH